MARSGGSVVSLEARRWLTATQFMKDEYPDSKSDLFAGFIARCAGLALPRGTAAMITMQSWMFLSSYEKLRASVLTHQRITSMLHLGARAFDSIGGEVVSSTAFVLANQPSGGQSSARRQAGTFIRLVDGASEAEKVNALSTALGSQTKEEGFHLASGEDFAAIPGSPIVYWLSERMRAVFTVHDPFGAVASLAVGLQTGDNNRFLRQWWEVSGNRTAFSCTSREDAAASGARWFPYNKGGEFRKWYGNQEYVLNWEHDGAEIRTFGTEDGGRPRSRAQNTDTYFSPSVSWSKVSSGAPAFRSYPAGFIYDVAGTSIFAATRQQRAMLLSFANSQVAFEQLAAVAPTLNYEVGQVAGLPVAAASAAGGAPRGPKAIGGAGSGGGGVAVSGGVGRNPLLGQTAHG
ncbi:Eco57I restriction-modification methylase domain-containing protein [Propionibacterium sp.]|uniref:Eco57I restriction-modification methylase domain-containing protein n=1 Tax=Propionibacterium sp. TaxID=1977903 RepID=UPI0039EAC806